MSKKTQARDCEVVKSWKHDVAKSRNIKSERLEGNMETYIKTYLDQTKLIADSVDQNEIKKMIEILDNIKTTNGRLFILGVGGSAANASHAVNDFRKIAGIETYAPTDNVSELTARTNDEGWDTTFIEWLKTSHINNHDVVLIFSVGGGSQKTSLNIVRALEYCKSVEAKVVSVVSRTGGYAKEVSDACVLVPVVDETRITPHAEGWQGVIWHLVVNAVGKTTL